MSLEETAGGCIWEREGQERRGVEVGSDGSVGGPRRPDGGWRQERQENDFMILTGPRTWIALAAVRLVFWAHPLRRIPSATWTKILVRICIELATYLRCMVAGHPVQTELGYIASLSGSGDGVGQDLVDTCAVAGAEVTVTSCPEVTPARWTIGRAEKQRREKQSDICTQ